MTKLEAFECAVRLVFSAPDDNRKDKAVQLAKDIACNLTLEEFETVMEEIECDFIK